MSIISLLQLPLSRVGGKRDSHFITRPKMLTSACSPLLLAATLLASPVAKPGVSSVEFSISDNNCTSIFSI